jgi:hypothetical protein
MLNLKLRLKYTHYDSAVISSNCVIKMEKGAGMFNTLSVVQAMLVLPHVGRCMGERGPAHRSLRGDRTD